MSISNGEEVNAASSNAAWMSRKVNTNTIGKVSLENTDGESGVAIVNTQRLINEVRDADGTAGEGDTTRKDYSSNNVVLNGDDRKVAIGKLDERFNGVTGHNHDGTNGESQKVDASDLASYNDFYAEFQTTTVEPGVGLSDIVTAQFAGKNPGGGDSALGVITSPPNNRVEVRTLLQGDRVEDATGLKVFARITEAAGIWTLTYFVNDAGVETAHSLSSQDIRIYFREVFSSATRPTIPPDIGEIGSLDVTADIITADQTNQGKTLLSSAAAADVGSVGTIGTPNATVANADHAHKGVFTLKKAGDSDIHGSITLSQGTNVTLTQVGNNIEVAASGGGGGGGSLELIPGTPTDPAPQEILSEGYAELEFDPDIDNGFVVQVPVSSQFTPGNDFEMKFNYSTPSTINVTRWKAVVDLFRPGTSVRGTPLDSVTVTEDVTSEGVANTFKEVTVGLSSVGDIGATAIAANDFLVVTFTRDAGDGVDSNTEVSRIIKTSVTIAEA